jgi:hypothetical protein
LPSGRRRGVRRSGWKECDAKRWCGMGFSKAGLGFCWGRGRRDDPCLCEWAGLQLRRLLLVFLFSIFFSCYRFFSLLAQTVYSKRHAPMKRIPTVRFVHYLRAEMKCLGDILRSSRWKSNVWDNPTLMPTTTEQFFF